MPEFSEKREFRLPHEVKIKCLGLPLIYVNMVGNLCFLCTGDKT